MQYLKTKHNHHSRFHLFLPLHSKKAKTKQNPPLLSVSQAKLKTVTQKENKKKIKDEEEEEHTKFVPFLSLTLLRNKNNENKTNPPYILPLSICF